MAATTAAIRPGDTTSAERPAASDRLRAQAWIRGPTTTRISAAISSTGTTATKTFSGRCSSNHAPMPAPTSDAGICHRSRCHWPPSSRRYPHVPEILPATRPTAFDMVAVTGG